MVEWSRDGALTRREALVAAAGAGGAGAGVD
jgi:hypothetical protein